MKNRQINLYLTQAELYFIEKHLKSREFLFCSTHQEAEKAVYEEHLMLENEIQKTILLPSSQIHFEKFNHTWKLSTTHSELIKFSYFGARENVMRVRFFYSPAILTDEGYTKKSAEFLKKADSFFRWLRRNFVKYPQLPNFYHAKNVEVKEAF